MTAKEKAARAALRDQVALQVTCICMADLSRQISEGRMPLVDIDKAISRIADISFLMANDFLRARDLK